MNFLFMAECLELTTTHSIVRIGKKSKARKWPSLSWETNPQIRALLHPTPGTVTGYQARTLAVYLEC
jgi:hypothetical protein